MFDIINNAETGFGKAVEAFESEFDNATAGLQKNLDSVQKVLDKINCLPESLLSKNPALTRLTEQLGFFGSFKDALNQVKGLVRAGVNELLSLTLEALQNISLPDIRSKLGGFFDALNKVNDEFKKLKKVAQAALDSINSAVGIVVCLLAPIGEPDPDENISETDPFSKFKQDFKDFYNMARPRTNYCHSF
jgi:hypothetical protein